MIKLCSFDGCVKKCGAKGLCLYHYQKNWVLKNIDHVRKYNREYSKIYRKTHELKKTIPWMHKARFGGLRDRVLERDRYKCVMCGMTDQEHLNTWGRHITVNHVDHTGRHSDYQNNDPGNLETLCLRCHGHKDATIHGKYAKYRVNNIEKGV